MRQSNQMMMDKIGTGSTFAMLKRIDIVVVDSSGLSPMKVLGLSILKFYQLHSTSLKNILLVVCIRVLFLFFLGEH